MTSLVLKTGSVEAPGIADEQNYAPKLVNPKLIYLCQGIDMRL